MCKMIMKWLGTGSAFNFELGNTCFLVRPESENGRVLLVDCGYTVPAVLSDWGQLDKITDVIITHLHADHVGGLETFLFYHYYVLGRFGKPKPRLYVATQALADALWQNSLRGGMDNIMFADGTTGIAKLEDYFEVCVGTSIEIDGLPGMELISTPHLDGMENYAIRFSNGVYFSGDSTILPPHDPEIIFQDCQFSVPSPNDPHIAYATLLEGLPESVRKKTHLIHLSPNFREKYDESSGFAGCVMPGAEFIL